MAIQINLWVEPLLQIFGPGARSAFPLPDGSQIVLENILEQQGPRAVMEVSIATPMYACLSQLPPCLGPSFALRSARSELQTSNT